MVQYNFEKMAEEMRKADSYKKKSIIAIIIQLSSGILFYIYCFITRGNDVAKLYQNNAIHACISVILIVLSLVGAVLSLFFSVLAYRTQKSDVTKYLLIINFFLIWIGILTIVAALFLTYIMIN